MSYKYVDERKVYTWIDGALRQCTIERQTLRAEEKTNPILFVKCNGQTSQIYAKDAFLNIENYEKQNPVHLYDLGAYLLNMRERDGKIMYSYIDEGVVIDKVFDNDIEVVYNEGKNVWMFIPQDIPSGYYQCTEVAQGMVDYVAIDENGNRTERKGAIRRVMLTDEQKKFVADFKEAYDNARKAGISFWFDRDDERLYAVNQGDKELMSLDEYEKKDYQDFEIANIESVDGFSVDVSFGYLNCDFSLYVKK